MRRSACGPVASSGLYRGEHLSDAVAEDQVGLPVQRRAALVDDDKVIAAELPRQARRGAHLEGGTADDQQVGVADHPAGVVVGLLGQKFPVQRHVRAHHAATAGAAGLAGAVEDEVHPIGGIAAGAVVAPGGAVDLLNVDAPGLLVEPVDVLGDDAVQSSLLFPPRQGHVGGVGLNGAGVQVAVIKNDLGSTIENSTMDNLGAISVDSYLGVTQVVAGVAVAAGTGMTQGGWNLGGSLVVDTLINSAAAKISSHGIRSFRENHSSSAVERYMSTGAKIKSTKAQNSPGRIV